LREFDSMGFGYVEIASIVLSALFLSFKLAVLKGFRSMIVLVT